MPIISLGNGRISGEEALLRWNHPVRGLLAPLEFLSVAEELDVISDVGRWVMREACRQLQEWNLEVPMTSSDLTIAVNLSGRQFNAAGLLEGVGRTVKAVG